jgi:hypothetical protein
MMNLRTLLATAAVTTIAATSAVLSTGPARADHHGTIRATRVGPHACTMPWSTDTDWCRAHGWTILPRLIVGPHAVVRYDRLPHCREEDGSGPQSLPCTYNILRGNERPDGNGLGLSYWIDRHHHTHYVWPAQPLGHPVWQALGDALAEGEKQERWERCWLDENHTHVRCPDGFEIRVYGQ